MRLVFIMSDFPKYVKAKNGKNLSYQRRLPQQLLLDTKCKPLYQQSLGLDVGATPSAIHKAVGKAHESFDLHCKMLANSSPDALTETELDRAATDLIKKMRMKPEQYAMQWERAKSDPHDERGYLIDWSAPDAVSVALFGNNETLYDLKRDEKRIGLSLEDTIKQRVADKLLQVAAYQPKTIGVVYDAYVSHKGLKNLKLGVQERRDNARVTNRIERLIGFIGDQSINDNTPQLISLALRQLTQERLKTVTTGTVKRELNDIWSFINWVRQTYSFDWYINKPDVGKHTPEERRPLDKDEQQALVEYCLSPDLPTEDRVSACISLLELQGGMMQSEIKRLGQKNLQLGHEYPYIMITGDTKTEERKRLVPIVLGLGFITEHFQETHDWLNSVVESSVSRKMSDFIRRVTKTEDLTAHCLRHTLKFNTDLNNVPASEAAAIGGWSGSSIGVSRHMLKYGAAGREYAGRVKVLQDTSLKIHKHLLRIKGSNVIQLHG